jgi:hypothetical protein
MWWCAVTSPSPDVVGSREAEWSPEPTPDAPPDAPSSAEGHEHSRELVSVIDLVTGGGVVVGVCVSIAGQQGASLAKGLARALPLAVPVRLPVPRLRWRRPGYPGGRLDSLVALGREQRHSLEQTGSALLDRLVPALFEAILQRVDLTAAAVQHVEIETLVGSVDLDRVIAAVDIDAVAERIDLDAIIDRLDLVRLTEQIMAAVDIPEVIRESTTSVASEGIREVRMQSIGADESVARVIDRFRLRRRQSVPDSSPALPPPTDDANRPELVITADLNEISPAVTGPSPRP